MQLTTRKVFNSMMSENAFINIIRFIIPLILANILQQFYHSADVVVVGLSGEPDAVGAIGSTTSYIALIKNVFIGFSVGANVVIARNIGAKNKEGISRSVHTSISMGILFGVIGAILGCAFAYPVFIKMGLTGKILNLSMRYACICIACMPFTALTNFLIAVLHAKGDTKTPFLVLTVMGILNVLLNLLFVLGFGMAVEGVALATAIANIASSTILWIYLYKKGEDCSLSFRKLGFKKEQFIEIAKIGFPAGLQSALFSISNLVISSSIIEMNNILAPEGSAYAPVLKANSAGTEIETFLFTALLPLATAASVFTARSAGAKNYREIKKIFRSILIISVVLGGVMALVIPFREPLMALFGVINKADELSQIAYSAAETRIFLKWSTLSFYAFMNACSGTIRGLGKSTTAAVITFIGTCALRVVWIYTIFEYFHTLESIYISYPLSWLLTGAVLFVFAIILINKCEKDNNVCLTKK